MSYEPEPPTADDSGVPDDRLRLMFTCCHPAPLVADAAATAALTAVMSLVTDPPPVPHHNDVRIRPAGPPKTTLAALSGYGLPPLRP